MAYIGQLYAVEKRARRSGIDGEQLGLLREEVSRPVLGQLHAYLLKAPVPPGGGRPWPRESEDQLVFDCAVGRVVGDCSRLAIAHRDRARRRMCRAASALLRARSADLNLELSLDVLEKKPGAMAGSTPLEQWRLAWKAEQPAAEPHRIAAKWGCVAVLCNPEREIPAYLLRGWAERVDAESDYGSVSQTPKEGVLVMRDGLIRISWPEAVQGDVAGGLDVVLVTANDPAITALSPNWPTAQTIAEAWNRANDHVEYFCNNRDCGIRTFQDDEICHWLRPRPNKLPPETCRY